MDENPGGTGRSGDGQGARTVDSLEAHALRIARESLDVDPERLAAWLEARCQAEVALMQRVQQLLAQVEQVPTWAQQRRAGGATLGGLAVPNGRIGAYRLVGCIGRGGMGEVWRGERCEGGFEQTVAIKLMLDSRSDWLRRFERERQILARLNHPNIAHLVDGGVTSAGLSWLAMEYVEGEPITTWCDRQLLCIEARVRLMLPICNAVQSAHQALVVHRDIKPANILVDAAGRPRLLDFGIAKLMDDTGASDSPTLIMTPAYAAPEQRSGGAITTATDVYQLGAVLYELLGGRASDAARWSSERQRSPRSSSSDGHPRLQPSTGLPGVPPPRLAATLRGDLGYILAKALAFDPGDRYGSARDLADDLRHWLGNRPVRARRLDAAYRLRKFLRRNRLAVAVSGLMAVALAVSLAVAWQWFQAERQQQLRNEKILGFMRELFSANRLEATNGQTLTVSELLEGAEERIERQFADDPQSRAALMAELGEVYRSLGRYPDALKVLEVARSLQPPLSEGADSDQLSSTLTLGHVLLETYEFDRVIELSSEALRALDATSLAKGATWRVAFQRMKADALGNSGRVDEALLLYEDSLDDRLTSHLDAESRAMLHNDYAHLLMRNSRAREAIDQFGIAEDLLLQDPHVSRVSMLVVRTSRALANLALGRTVIAVQQYARALPEMEEVFGEGHNRTTIVRSQMAQALMGVGRYREALELVERNLGFMQGDQVTEMDRVLVGKGVRPRLLVASLRFDKALPLVEEGVAYLDANLAGPSFDRVAVRSVLVNALIGLGRFDAAGAELERAYSELRQFCGLAPDATDPMLEEVRGRLELLRGRPGLALRHFEAAITGFSDQMGGDSPRATRARVHQVWARMEAEPGVDRLSELQALRAKLATALDTDEATPLWQIDQLIGMHAARLGIAPVDPGRIARSLAGLRLESGLQELPAFVGLSAL